MRLDAFDYDLPASAIAQEPVEPRDAARLLVVERETGERTHRHVADLADLLAPGDLMVVNDTRVIPARLVARRATGGRLEVFALEATATAEVWTVLIRSSKRPRVGEVVAVGDGEGLELVAREGEGRWQVRPAPGSRGFAQLLEAHGRMPLPPYIRREDGDRRAALDRERYQTVYARQAGAVAAPTAGLHFTDELLERLAARGVTRAPVTLHVGLGTFAPVRSEDLDQHEMHAESWWVPPETVHAIQRTRAQGGRVVAIGTTTVRALESAAEAGFESFHGRTRLLIQPGYRFRAVDALLTNFHLPRSTLLALVSAFLGHERTMDSYRTAVTDGYRFYSYGDAMLIC